MSLLNVVRQAVKVADEVTKPLQDTVTFQRCTGTDAYGQRTYASAVPLRANVDWKLMNIPTAAGIISASRPFIMFTDITALMAATANQGVSDFDKITLSNGTTGPIANIAGFIDAQTGKPYATEVVLG